MRKKEYRHNPTHLFIDNTAYFITAAIYKKRPLLQNPHLKTMLLERIKLCFDKHGWELHHWVILDNHYHILGKSSRGKALSNITTDLHGFMGYHIKETTSATGRVWWNYWDYCPRNERDYMVRLNYLLNNPVKHGYVDNLYDYPYSSFHETVESQGADGLRQQFRDYSDYRSLVLREAYDDDF
ncbi:transposase [Anaerolineales bacterium HSG6]|nr:transposase [Anaerolineales bacterium HSG6]